MTDWWRSGETCEQCGICFCSRHSPIERTNEIPRSGPLGTSGFDIDHVGPIEVLVLDDHTSGYGERTRVGEAVYHAKYSNGRLGSPSSAAAVANACCHWMELLFDGTRRPKPIAVVAVPAKAGRRGRSLPAVIAEGASRSLGIPMISPLQWRPGTSQAKDLVQGERESVLEGKLEATGEVPAGLILLVDDILQTGATISVVARALKRMGAEKVIALAPTRARSAGRTGSSSLRSPPRTQRSYPDSDIQPF